MTSRVLTFFMVLPLSAILVPSVPAETQSRPNILFCIADDASYPYMGAYGCSWVRTPTFDRIAREGILFSRAYTPNAKCAPSRSCILTGRNPWQLKEACNHVPFFPEEFKTYAEALQEHGYFVGKTAKGWGPGESGAINGRPRQLAGRPFDGRKATPPANGIAEADYAANFSDFLAAKPAGTPWCFWYGGLEPHRAYEFGSGVAQGGRKPADIDRVPPFWPDNEIVRTDMLDYAFELEHFDRHLGRMLEQLEAAGELDNTLVIATADNGMPFPRVKGQAYEYSNHLPLAIMWPRGIKNPGRVVSDFVSFVDFAPTFIELAGIPLGQCGMQPFAGISLTDIFHAEATSGRINPRRDHVLIGQERHDVGRPRDVGYPIRGIVDEEWIYLHNFEPSRWPACNPETGYLNSDGSPTKTQILQLREADAESKLWQLSFGKRGAEELYRRGSDPECMKNLANQQDFESIRRRLQEQLFSELRQQDDPRMFGRGAVFDEYIYADPKTRGFYERFMKGEKVRAGWVNETDFAKRPLD